MKIQYFRGKEISRLIPDLAKLRITVFYDFPYLYEGSLEYEENYLKIYTQSDRSICVAVFDDNKLVGAATALPLSDEADYVQEPFVKANWNLDEIYYFGESILLKEYRNQGLGHEFFKGREMGASEHGFKICAFCSVQRSTDHPMRPKDYRPLDEFWIKRGYEKRPELESEFSWPDIGSTQETKKKMTYWMRTLC